MDQTRYDQEYAQIDEQFLREMTLSEDLYQAKVSTAFAPYLATLQSTDEQKRCAWQQYQQVKDEAKQECVERNVAAITTHMQRIEELKARMQDLPHDAVYPFWHLRVIRITEGAPPHFKHLFEKELDIYSTVGLQEYFRLFLLKYPAETQQSSPLQLETLRITHEYLFSGEGKERVDRAVYLLEFRQRRELVGINHIQNEIIGAWIAVGGLFVHRRTNVDRGRSRRIHFLPEEHIE
jgi:hypothetical protein